MDADVFCLAHVEGPQTIGFRLQRLLLRLEDEDAVPEIADTQFSLDRPQRSVLPRHAGDVRLMDLFEKRLVVHRTSEGDAARHGVLLMC